MCDLCVIESVKERMLSRRDLFKAGASLAAAGSVVAASAPAAMAEGHSKVEDLTHTYDDKFPTYFGAPGVEIEQKFNFADNGFNLFQLNLNEHQSPQLHQVYLMLPSF